MAQVPYEFLVRFDHQTGAIKGAHCKLFDTVTGREGDAQAVAIAGAQGFPLSEILSSVETGAVIAMEDALATLNAKQVELDAANETITQLQASITQQS